MARNTQRGRAVATEAAAETAPPEADRIAERSAKIALKVRKLERQVWKLEREIHSRSADLAPVTRRDLKHDLERLAARIRDRIEQELADIADSL
jgi:hypothetical protein